MNTPHKKGDDAFAEPNAAIDLVSESNQSSREAEGRSGSDAMPKMIGHFRVEKKLGAGGMSVVYKCTDMAVNRTVAVKVLQPRLLSEEKWMMRFQQEAKAIGRLSHPNIINVHHFDVHGDEPYIAMDYVGGESLDQLLQKQGSLSAERSIKLMSQVMSALAHAHANGVVHRDLKPSNIMIVNADSDTENVKLLDFGIAKIETESGHKLTQTGEVFGSPLYMSPEQCQGKSADELSDQYSVGCMLYECLTGCPPFSGESSFSILMKHINDQPPSLKEGSLGKHFDPSLENIVQKMLQKEPSRRFASIDEAAQILDSGMLSEKFEQPHNAKGKAENVSGNNKPFLIATAAGGFAFIILLLILLANSYMKSEPIAGKPVVLESVLDHATKDYGDDSVLDYLERDNNFTANNFDALKHNWKRITDKAMTKIAQMPNLKRLDLTNCGDITPTGFAIMATSPKIEELILNGTQFDDKDVPIILNMKALRYLSLNGTKIHEDGLQKLSATKLQGLDLRSTNVSNLGCKAIADIKTLQRLDLSDNRRITKEGIRYLAGMPQLDFLEILDNSLTAEDIEPLRHMKKLRELRLARTFVDNNALDYINQIGSLEELWIGSTKISQGALLKLTGLHHLNHLRCHGYTPSQSELKTFKALMPGCQIIKN